MSNRSKQVLTLVAFDKAISWPDIKGVTDKALLFFQDAFHVDRVSITLFNSDQQNVSFYTLDTSVPELLNNSHISLNDADWKSHTRRTRSRYQAKLSDKKNLSQLESTLLAAGIQASLYTPLLIGEDLIGSINLGSLLAGGISRQDRDLVYLLSSRLALALYHARLHDALKAKEQQLITSQNNYRELIDQAGDAILKGNAVGDIVQANIAATVLFGYPQNDLLSVNVSDLFYKDVLKDKPLRYDLLLEGKTVITERTLRRKDGSTFPVEMSSKKLSDGSFVSIIRDLTERQDTYQKLTDSESQIRALIEAVPAPLYAKDRDGKYIFLNKAYLIFFGKTSSEMLGKTARQCWPKEIAASFEEDDRVLLTENKKQTYSSQVFNSKGDARHVNIHKARYFDTDGKIAGFIGTLWDYTDLKAAEERYHDLFTFSPDPIVLHDGIHVLKANLAAAKFFKTETPEKYFSRPLSDLIHPDSLSESRARIKKLSTSGHPNDLSSQKFVISTGEVRDVEVMSVPVEYEGRHIVMTSFRDITEQKRGRDQLHASEENFRNLFEANPNPVVVHVDGRVVAANQAALKFKGSTSLKDFLGKNIFSFVHEDYRQESLDNARKIKKTGKPSSPGIQFYLGKNGEAREVEARGIPLVYENKDAIMVSFRDVTDERAISNALVGSEERYRRFFEYSPTPMILHDMGILVQGNQAALNFVGVSNLVDFLGKNIFDHFIHPRYAQRSLDGIAKLLESDKPGPLKEQKYMTLAGKERWVEAVAVPIHQSGKKLVLLAFNDIHERVLARQQIEESRQQLQLITENVTQLILLFDLNYTPLYMNSTASKWLDVNPENLAGLSVEDLIPQKSFEAVKQYLPKLTSGQACHFPHHFNSESKIGTDFWVSLIPVRNAAGEVSAFLAQIEDVTEKETARRELAENKELLELIVDTIPGLFSYTDASQKYLYVNQAYADWNKKKRSEIIGNSLKQVLPPETYRYIKPYLLGVSKGREQAYSRDTVDVRGNNRTLDIRYIPHFDQAKKTKAFLTSIQDVTQQKEFELHQLALRELAQALTVGMDPHAVGKVSARSIRNVFNSDALTVELYDFEAKFVEGIYSEDTILEGEAPQEVTTSDIPFSNLSPDWSALMFESHCLNRSEEDLKQGLKTVPFGDNRPSKSLLFVPLRWEGSSIGMVSVQSYTPNKYSTEDIPLLQSYVDQIGGALIRSQRDAQLRDHQRNLEQEERKYRSIIENAGDAVFVTTMTGTIKTINEQANTSLGYTSDELLGLNFKVIDSQYLKLIGKKDLARLKSSGNSITLHSKHVRKDKTSFPVELRISVTQIDKQHHLLCFARDITDRKLAELREQSLQKLARDLNESTDMHTVGQMAAKAVRSFFDSDAFAIEYYDLDQRVIVGVYSEDTFRGKSEPREVTALNTAFNSVKDDFIQRNSFSHVRNRTNQQLNNLNDTRPFGSNRFSHSLLFAPITWEGGNVGVLTVQSYTDDKYSEEDLPNIQTFANQIGGALIRTRKDEELLAQQAALVEGEQKYRSIIENAGDALLVASLQGKILAFNQHATQSLGYTEQELLKINLVDINPWFKNEFIPEQLSGLSKTASSTTIDTSHLRKDGLSVPVELRVGAMEMQGEPCILYFARDISERKNYEVFYTALRKMARDLTASLRPRDVGKIAASVLYNLFAHDAFILYTIDLGNNRGLSLYVEDVFSGDKRPRELPADKKPFDFSSFQNVMVIPTPLLINPAPGAPLPQQASFGNTRRKSKSLVFVPFFWEGRQIGTFSLQSYTKNKFDDQDAEKLKIFANQIGGALVRSQTDLELTLQTNTLLEREQELESAVSEKEVLLKEVYHRTKNNMQVMVGLLEMHSYKTKHPETHLVLGEMINRISSMSMVHDLLYRSKSLSEIKLDTYLNKLVSRLITAYQTSTGEISLDFNADSIPINLQVAVPLGLVINEIVSNTLKHGFPDNRDGQLSFKAKAWGKKGLDLIISDNGIGLIDDINLSQSTSMGMRIIQDIVELQLFGQIHTKSRDGLTYHIQIPDLNLE